MAAAPPCTTTHFVDLVRRSGLVDAPRLQPYLQESGSGTPPAEPKAIARRMVRDGLLTVYQADQILKGSYKGFFVGKYRVLEPVGAGGMGKVYLCEHVAMRHKVAMKVLPARKGMSGPSPAALARFRREARAIAALNHPHVVRAHDLDRTDTFHYLIMEYVEGVTLYDLVAPRGPLAPERAAHYVAQAALGLQHIHEAGLVHRDLKPGNLVLDRQGVVKILDLGLARFKESDEDLTNLYGGGHALLGTADYISPEQAVRSSEVDVRSDLYSLGATLFFLLTGRAPFQGQSLAAKLMSHQLAERPSVRDQVPGVPPELDAVVRRLMARSVEERFQEPNEVVEALAPWTEISIPPPADEDFPKHGQLKRPSSGHSSTLRQAAMTPHIRSTFAGPKLGESGRAAGAAPPLEPRTSPPPLPVRRRSSKRAVQVAIAVGGTVAILAPILWTLLK